MAYLRARLQQERDVIAYRVYMADSIYYYARGKAAGVRLSDMLARKASPPDTRTGDEVAADLINRMGLKVV